MYALIYNTLKHCHGALEDVLACIWGSAATLACEWHHNRFMHALSLSVPPWWIHDLPSQVGGVASCLPYKIEI